MYTKMLQQESSMKMWPDAELKACWELFVGLGAA
jgi:hypothetical protein